MQRKYAAFDLETAIEFPDGAVDWRAHRPLGICCAAVLPADAERPILWHGKIAKGKPATRMTAAEAEEVVQELTRLVAAGYTLVTWNGVGFDFDILAEESQQHEACKNLAVSHVDMMFHVFCDRGFPVALDKAAQALGVPGKPAGMSGLLAPRLWAERQHQQVLDYVAQDVRMALAVAHACDSRKRFEWKTQRGTTSTVPLPRGWLTVREALRLPKPDTSWMDKPIPRQQFTQWLGLK